MNLRTYLTHVLIVTYLVLTACAMLYTLFRVETPVPWFFVRYFYGMMAPYQGVTPLHQELIAEGKFLNGEWEKIPLEEAMPFLRAERNIRSTLVSYRVLYGTDTIETYYNEFARELMEFANRHGKDYETVRLQFEQWELSPEGPFERRIPGETTVIPITEYP